MSEDKIPTAEATYWQLQEYVSLIIDKNCEEVPYEGTNVDKTSLRDWLMEFLINYRKAYAKSHVTAALKAAAAKLTYGGPEPLNDMLSAYPLDKIN